MEATGSSPNGPEEQVRALYQKLMDGWNKRSAEGMAEPFAEDGEMIGFDGSQVIGRAEVVSHLQPIFEKHLTPAYVCKIKSVRLLSSEVAVLRAIAGMVPHGQTDLDPKLNSHHTVVAAKRERKWEIVLFQNTPAQFHGRPDLVEKMTEELRELL